MFLTVGDGSGRCTFQPDDPAFLDRLANECERAVREFVGDVPQENVA